MNISTYSSIAASGFCSLEEIGRGSERAVYISKLCENKVLKLSLEPYKNKQIIREIKFYKYLIRHKVPMTHLPKLYGIVKQKHRLGIIQEYINAGQNLKPDEISLGNLKGVYDLPLFIKQQTVNQKQLDEALDKFLNYLLTYNIVVNDLQPHNLRIRVFEKAYKVYLIDGFGSRLLIPIDLVFKSLGRKHIEHQWRKFKDISCVSYNDDSSRLLGFRWK